jgi:pimeloyl-ACP methyl ester carboxylesterase
MIRTLIYSVFAVLLTLIGYGACAFAAPATLEREEIVRAGQAAIRVTVRGQGEPIIFIPSLGRSVRDFDSLADALAKAGYQAIQPEPRGIGGSTGPMQNITNHDLAADVAAVIRAFGPGRATLIGHAHGNRIARLAAVDNPDLVKQIILLAAGGMVPASPEIQEAFARVFNPQLSKQDRLAAIQQTFFAKGHDAKVWEEGWYLDAAAAQAGSGQGTRLQEWWSGGGAPILVLQAREDVIAVPENSRRLAAEYPDRVTVVDIPNSGHAMLPEQPDRIAAAILSYLRR